MGFFDGKDIKKSSTTLGQKDTGGFFSSYKQLPVLPKAEPKKGVKSIAGEVVKSIVKPIATTVARPVQAIAALSGATADEIDAYTKDKFGDFVAPTPRNASDVVKDIGRAVETVLTVPLGGGAIKALKLGSQAVKGAKVTQSLGQLAATSAIEGAGYGVGSALEQGGAETKGIDILKDATIGAVTGAVAPVAFKAVGKVFKGKAPKVPEIIPETKVPVSAIEKEVPEVIPTGKATQQATPEIPKVEQVIPEGKQQTKTTTPEEIPTPNQQKIFNEIKDSNPRDFTSKSIEQQTSIFNQKVKDNTILDVIINNDTSSGLNRQYAYRAYNDLLDTLNTPEAAAIAKRLSYYKGEIISETGQALSLSRVGSKNSTAEILADVAKQRAEKIVGKNSKKINKEIDDIIREVESSIKGNNIPPSNSIIKDILKTIQC